MKKVLLATAAVILMTGCSQNEEFENEAQNAEIGIGTVVKKTSRATVVDNTNFKAFNVSSFIVAADFDFATTWLGAAFMNNVPYTGTQGSWETNDTNKYYWPTDKNVQFFAYPNDLTFVAPTEATKGYPTLAFTIGASSNLQTDLVVASENMGKPVSDNQALLNFKHVLTRINFSYKPEAGYTYAISEIKINGVNGGAATYTYAADVANGTWTGGALVTEGYTYPITVADNAVEEYYALDSENGSLMLLPQTVTADAEISITYKVTKNGATFCDGTKIVKFPANTTWGVGKNIRYKLTLPAGENEIGIATDVKDWGVETPESI